MERSTGFVGNETARRLEVTYVVQVKNTAFEKHYRIAELAEMWNLGRETVRKLVMNEPGVIKIRLGRKKAHIFSHCRGRDLGGFAAREENFRGIRERNTLALRRFIMERLWYRHAVPRTCRFPYCRHGFGFVPIGLAGIFPAESACESARCENKTVAPTPSLLALFELTGPGLLDMACFAGLPMPSIEVQGHD